MNIYFWIPLCIPWLLNTFRCQKLLCFWCISTSPQLISLSVTQRVMMQIVQELCKRPGLNKCGFDMPTIYIPNPNKVKAPLLLGDCLPFRLFLIKDDHTGQVRLTLWSFLFLLALSRVAASTRSRRCVAPSRKLLTRRSKIHSTPWRKTVSSSVRPSLIHSVSTGNRYHLI